MTMATTPVTGAGAGVASSTLALHGGTPVSAKPVPFMSTGLSQADKAAAIAVLDSGMLRAAKKCEELERRFAQMSQARHAMTCANGTCALQLAYEPLFRPGDEILVPAWSYIATVSMIVARGCRPIFVDADPKTYQVDLADAARKVTRQTTGIAFTHLYGAPVDIDGTQALASKHGLKVVYDAAQAHLATWKGQGIGAFGDAVTYSFYATKNLGTGEGGLISTNDDALATKIKLLRSHGETQKYLHEHIGYNYRMNDITGAIGCSKLDRLMDQTRTRQKSAARLDAIIAKIPGLHTPKVVAGGESVWHLYVIQIDAADAGGTPAFRCTRDEFAAALGKEGVPTAVHYPRSLPHQPALAKFAKGDTPIADRLASRVLALPMHHDLTDEHFRTIEESLNKVARAMRV